MIRVDSVIGQAADPALAERLHALRHSGGIEYVVLEPADTARRRLRVETDQGTDCAIALPRDAELGDGAVLYLSEDRAVVVRLEALHWLTIEPRDAASALALGYHCGNLHWKVEFSDGRLRVALEHDKARYLARLDAYLEDGRAKIIDL